MSVVLVYYLCPVLAVTGPLSHAHAFAVADLEHRDVTSRMEQKGGTGRRTGDETSANLHAAVWGVLHHPEGGDGPAAQGAGVLLREHELHEGVPEDRANVLQK